MRMIFGILLLLCSALQDFSTFDNTDLLENRPRVTAWFFQLILKLRSQKHSTRHFNPPLIHFTFPLRINYIYRIALSAFPAQRRYNLHLRSSFKPLGSGVIQVFLPRTIIQTDYWQLGKCLHVITANTVLICLQGCCCCCFSLDWALLLNTLSSV